jgi:hypothetical protein
MRVDSNKLIDVRRWQNIREVREMAVDQMMFSRWQVK